MIDVVLYEYDRDGCLTLQERSFRSHRELARFFGSEDAITWDWAEVHTTGPDGRSRVVRYSADRLSSDEASRARLSDPPWEHHRSRDLQG